MNQSRRRFGREAGRRGWHVFGKDVRVVRSVVSVPSRRLAFVALAFLGVAGCAGGGGTPPANDPGVAYMREKQADIPSPPPEDPRPEIVDAVCAQAGDTQFIMPPSAGFDPRRPRPDRGMRYSPGDRINIKVFDGDEFSGDYVVGPDGTINLPIAGEIPVAGLSNRELEKRLTGALLRANLFKAETLRLAVRPVQFAPIHITVGGAVFRPGRVTINLISAADKGEAQLRKFGDNPLERFVAAGLRSGGGVRPDADMSAIYLVRKGQRYRLDWRGAFTGNPVDDAPLVAGDHLEVTPAPCFQSGLVRPSQITPDGVRVFISNLVSPAFGNAPAAVSQFAQSLPYGARFIQGLAAGNCIGGALASNANRHAVLVSRNLKTGVTEVIQRSIEELIRSADRDAMNPYLMPEDAIACYDSEVTNFREVMVTLSTVLGPLNSLKTLTK